MKTTLAAVMLSAVIASVTGAVAQDYPKGPVKLITGFPPGGGSDTIARLAASSLAEKWKVPVVVEVKAGADGTIAADIVAKSKPDGYTLLWMTSNLTSTPSLRKLNFDPINDLIPITIVAGNSQVLMAHPTFKPNTVAELIKLAKEKPTVINFGSTGVGGPPYLLMRSFMKETGVQLTHVPFKGSGEALPPLLAGEIEMMFKNPLSSIGQAKDGTLKAIAISGTSRSPQMPDVPTFRESGIKGLDGLESWWGFAAPAGTPPQIIEKIYRDVVEVLAKPEPKKVVEDGGLFFVLQTPAETHERMKREVVEIRELLGSEAMQNK